MKSLVRWSATVALVGSTVIGSLVAGAVQVLALTQEQIIQKLANVPVFTIANSQGIPLTLASKSNAQQQNAPVTAGVFVSQKDAQTFFDALKKNDPTLTKNPNLVKDYKVIPIPLGEAYRLSQQNQGKPERLSIEYVPSRQQVESAIAILKQSGQNVQQFNGTPLFTLGEKKGNEVGYLIVQNNNQKQTPMFFDREVAQAFLDQLKKQPGVSSNMGIQVLTLEGVLQAMQAGDKDAKRQEFLKQIELVPPAETLQLIQQQRSNAPAQNRAPAAPSQPKR